MANIDKNFRVKNGLDVKGTINLAAIAESKSETAVDVFVYDTSKDTDGGAWRHRTQHTSWYNETLNSGSRKEFPAVAVIVAETDKVTIYDGDDPSLPMWKAFNADFSYASRLSLGAGGSFSSVTALNGSICLGSKDGPTNSGVNALFALDFAAGRATKRANTGFLVWSGGLSGANSDGSYLKIGDDAVIFVNDVAMTVLPDAPVDPATGLPVPTIAVATDGGVSVIKDDGTVVDIVGDYGAAETGFFGEEVLFHRFRFVKIGPIPDADTTEADFDRVSYSYNGAVQLPLDRNFTGSHVFQKPLIYNGGETGLATLLDDETGTGNGPEGSMVAYTTSDYNTGWMNGDIKGAFLSDTDDTDLVASGELVTNGDDWVGVVNGTSTLPDGASNVGWYETSNGTYSVSNGILTITNGTNGRTGFYWPISVVAGASYEAEWVSQTGGIQVRITDTIDPNDISPLRVFNLGSTGKKTFVAPSSTLYVSVTNYDSGVGDTGSLDKISVQLVDADRSVNDNGLIVNGTVTRTAVATGADLVAYSGFSSSNYLEQPYNSDLDFGTGDFCVMGWVKQSSISANQIILAKANAAATSVFSFFTSASTGYLGYFHPTSGSVSSSKALALNAWNHIGLVRSSGLVTFYINGVAVYSSTPTAFDLTRTNDDILRVGKDFSVNIASTSSMSLLRISATAPSAAQIKKIYEDEKFLFQENAQATLYGTSDAVTALGHDEDTGLLHVGTSAGRSVFQGLRRVDNTTDAVGTAISAVGGLVVEE